MGRVHSPDASNTSLQSAARRVTPVSVAGDCATILSDLIPNPWHPHDVTFLIKGPIRLTDWIYCEVSSSFGSYDRFIRDTWISMVWGAGFASIQSPTHGKIYDTLDIFLEEFWKVKSIAIWNERTVALAMDSEPKTLPRNVTIRACDMMMLLSVCFLMRLYSCTQPGNG